MDLNIKKVYILSKYLLHLILIKLLTFAFVLYCPFFLYIKKLENKKKHKTPRYLKKCETNLCESQTRNIETEKEVY